MTTKSIKEGLTHFVGRLSKCNLKKVIEVMNAKSAFFSNTKQHIFCFLLQ